MDEPKQVFDSFGNLVKDAKAERSDFKMLAMLCMGLLVGLFMGYQLNLEKDAQVRADKDCGVCQDNLNIMVSNFNMLAKNCEEAKQYARDIPLLPAAGLNQTVRVYAT